MARGYNETRSQTDLRFGLGRARLVTVSCYGCPARLKRATHTVVAITLCVECRRRVERVYEARIRAAGIVPCVKPGARWAQAWADLASAINTGDRDLIDTLLQAGAAVA